MASFFSPGVIALAQVDPAYGGSVIAQPPLPAPGRLVLPTVDTVSFMANQEVEEQLEIRTSQPGNEIVCLITEHGQYLYDDDPETRTGLIGTRASRILDARTGNLLFEQLKL